MKLPLHVDWDGTGGHRGGSARPVLALLHGFAGDGTAWAPVREGLRSLGPTLAIDLIGHGKSPAPDDPRRYRMEACLDDLEAVLKGLGIPAAWWVGYSMGGRTALQLAVHKPHLVRGLVLESATAGIASPIEQGERRKADEALAQSILTEGMEAFVEQWLNQPLFEGLKRLPEEQLAAERERRVRQRPEGLAQSLRGMGAGAMQPVWERLSEIDVPALAIAGEDDEQFCRLAGRLALAIPGAQMLRIPHAGHMPHTENPRLFLNGVRGFVLGHERESIADLA